MTAEQLIKILKKYSTIQKSDVNKYELLINGGHNCVFLNIIDNTSHKKIITDNGINIISLTKKTGFSSEDSKILKNIIMECNYYITEDILIVENIINIIQKKSILKNIEIFKKCNINNIIGHINKMEEWAAQTYENQKICFAIGIIGNICVKNCVNIFNIYDDDLIKVITSAIDTVIVCDINGNIINYEVISGYKGNEYIVPYAFRKIAAWTYGNKSAIVLTSRGEILIFYNMEMMYAKRNGTWYSVNIRSLEHLMDGVLKKRDFAIKDNKRKFKDSIIATCIDVSFRHTGARIGIVDCEGEDLKDIIHEDDMLDKSNKERVKFFNMVIRDKKFYEIKRAIRQELAAIDGAIILYKDGTVISIGAILNITDKIERRTTGGRSVAAQHLAKYGVGIKVSADGGITGWRRCKSANEEDITVKGKCLKNIEKFIELF